MNALGMIETYGMIPAVAGADVMLKTADVCFLEKVHVGAGLVSVIVSGEVAAVQTSVAAAAEQIHTMFGAKLVSKHVIARPDIEVGRILTLQQQITAVVEQTQSFDAQNILEQSLSEQENRQDILEKKAQVKGIANSEHKQDAVAWRAKLNTMAIRHLRNMAKNTQGMGLSSREIDLATKKTLITALMKTVTKREE